MRSIIILLAGSILFATSVSATPAQGCSHRKESKIEAAFISHMVAAADIAFELNAVLDATTPVMPVKKYTVIRLPKVAAYQVPFVDRPSAFYARSSC